MPSRQNPDASRRKPATKSTRGRSSTADSRRDNSSPWAGAGWQPGRFEAACAALGEVLAFSQPADVALSHFFRSHRQLGQRDRAAIADAIYDILRHLRWLQKLCPGGTPRQIMLAALLKLRGLSASMVTPLARSQELEWIKEIRATDATDLTPAERLDLPDWLYDRLVAQYAPEDLETLGRALQTSAPLDLRVNTLKLSRAEAIAALAAQGIEGMPTPFSPEGIRLMGKPPINLLPQFIEGALEVQDEGSQIIAQLVAPRRTDLVVDFCAGAGGKTLALGAAMASHGRLYAFDVSDRRLSNFRPRLKRSGLSNVFPQRITGARDSHVKRLAGKADRVLLDVPCSGLGTLRRNPDLKWRTREPDIAEMIAKQSEILHFASDLVKPGGRLVYATCSLLREENEDVLQAFLQAHPGFRPMSAAEVLSQARIGLDTGEFLRLRPDLHGTDGFFAAVLQRSAA